MNTICYIRFVNLRPILYPLLFHLHFVAFFNKAKWQMPKLQTSTLKKINVKLTFQPYFSLQLTEIKENISHWEDHERKCIRRQGNTIL